MLRLRSWIRAFFGFSRTETNAFLILCPLILVFLFSEPLYRRLYLNRLDYTLDLQHADSILALMDRAAESADSLFLFDPNQATPAEFQALGLQDAIANRVVRYREKGGVFKQDKDLLRIFGMDSAWYSRIQPWIRLVDRKVARIEKVKQKPKPALIDINLADSIQLMGVYGIGPALAKRIGAFRSRLGGFVSMDQVSEVYGLDSTVVERMRKRFYVGASFSPRQLHINEASPMEFSNHPYIKRHQAQAIAAFRTQHGRLEKLEDLLEIKVLDSGWLEKVRPYLTVD